MSLTILNVAYPLAPVSTAAAGGAEQILASLDAALVAAGHDSIVVAQEGSRVADTLVPVRAASGDLDDAAQAAAQARHRDAIRSALARWPVDLVHLHGVDFHTYLPAGDVPVLCTLHLPPSWYPAEALAPTRPRTWLNCVSAAQHRACPDSPGLLPPILNGIDVESFQAPHAKRGFALCLGRICPEKGFHLAADAAKRAGIPLLIAGEVFRYDAHQRYFETEIRPRLDAQCRYVGPADFARKRTLLSAARCLLVPSLVPETSSLVTREALACGTPVIAFPNGALPETIEHGRTGFLVPDLAAMAEAIDACRALDPDICRSTARERFDARRMNAAYLDLYSRLSGSSRERACPDV